MEKLDKTPFREYIFNLSRNVSEQNLEQIELICKELKEKRKTQSRIYIAGNGGSNAIAEHFSIDISSGIHYDDGYIYCLNLGSNSSQLLSNGNDRGF